MQNLLVTVPVNIKKQAIPVKMVEAPNVQELANQVEIKQEEDEVEYYMEIAAEDEEDVLGGVEVEPVSFIWTNEATSCLIEQYRKYRKLVGQTTRIRSLRDMFEVVSAEMKKRGFYFSSQKCENKWRVLERKYKQLIYREKLNKPGRIKDFYNWHHKTAMDDIFKNNLQQSSFDPKLLEAGDASNPSGSSDMNKTSSELIDDEDCLTMVIKAEFAEIKNRMDIAEANKERRHKEKMAMRKGELEVQKKLLSLKSKKLEVERAKLLAAAKQLDITELKF